MDSRDDVIAEYSALYESSVILDNITQIDHLFNHIGNVTMNNLKNESIGGYDVDDDYIEDTVIAEELDDQGKCSEHLTFALGGGTAVLQYT